MISETGASKVFVSLLDVCQAIRFRKGVTANILSEIFLVSIDLIKSCIGDLLIMGGPSRDDGTPTCESGCVNTGSASSVRWTKDKLRECQDVHSNCRPIIQGYLPDRVISMSPLAFQERIAGDEMSQADVKLYKPSGGEASAYATLSHRWGNSQPLSLRLDSISSFQQNIPWQSLPKTFQQAMVFAWKLGIEYIWIDSLCIIQDSKEDWLEQSGKMADIYENSTITLAGTASSGPESGLFIEPSLHLQGYVTDGTVEVVATKHTEVQCLLAKASTDNPVMHIKASPSHNSPAHFTHDDLPLLKRGWVYQERLLSPRIVHFGAIDLIWECNCDMACYCKHYRGSGSRNAITHPVKPQHIASVRAASEGHGHVGRWVQVVEAYTAMDFTYESDRLPAIAGVAKQFRRNMANQRYIAGLWEEGLLSGLTWSRATIITALVMWKHRVLELKPRPFAVKVSPSWSWISVPGAITYPMSRYMGTQGGGPKVKKIEFDNDGETEFMTLRGGTITLHGKLMTFKQRVIHTSSGARYGAFRPGFSGFFGVSRDYGPDEDEVINEWQTIHPRWAKNLSSEIQDDSSSVYQLPANEDMDDEMPIYLADAKYISTQQCSKNFYGLYMGWRRDEGASTAMFLLLDRIDGPEPVYVRLGLGEYQYDKQLFADFKETQDVVLV